MSIDKIENGYWKDTYAARFNGVTAKGRVRIIKNDKSKTAILPENVNFPAKYHVSDRGRVSLVIDKNPYYTTK
ncbi:MAG: hypothetical protein R3230_00895 [Nitrosopumilaceae archaeon]|nr:hypothetical protein [Nitrosopumilaceae archaeon]